MVQSSSEAVWRKSSRSSNNGNCVEVADLEQVIAVRDSKRPENGTLVFGRDSWAEFVGATKSGEFGK